MKPKEFVDKYLSYAKETESKTGISAIFILAQAAHESGWGVAAPGNMFFGVKDTDGINGNEQLLTTTEYSRKSNEKFPNILSITPVIRNGQKYFKYRIKTYFRKYNTAEESFTDHAKYFFKNNRYAKALSLKNDPIAFAAAIAEAGYATDPNYKELLTNKILTIKKLIQ